MMTRIFGLLSVIICLAGFIACSQKSESGSEVLIKFDGGTITMDEITRSAGAQIELLRKREREIKYRTAVQLLMDKIHKIEGKDSSTADSKGTSGKTVSGTGDLSADKNNPKKDEAGKETKKPAAIPEGEELRKVFIKYNVQNNLKKPE